MLGSPVDKSAEPTNKCLKRIAKDLRALKTLTGDEGFCYVQGENNFREIFFLLYGPKGTDFEGGEYIGRLFHSHEYPFKPPRIEMITPSGRFETDKRLCLSFSDYHPESWCPAWGTTNILHGFLSVMVAPPEADFKEGSGIGYLRKSSDTVKEIAAGSIKWNMENRPKLYSELSETMDEIRRAHVDKVRKHELKREVMKSTKSVASPPQ